MNKKQNRATGATPGAAGIIDVAISASKSHNAEQLPGPSSRRHHVGSGHKPPCCTGRCVMTPTELRVELLHADYSPIPSIGKVPPLKDWQKKITTNAEEIALWAKVYPEAKNTGLLTQKMPTLDIDIRHLEAAQAIEDLVRERFDERGYILVRIGNAPKRAVTFRTDTPFKKIAASLTAPDGSTDQKIELLCDGQQLTAFGIHPDTNKPYRWHGGEPGTIKREDLPDISEDEAKALVHDAVKLLCESFGYKTAATKKKANGDGSGANPEDWDTC
jgi:hypothetical protein